MRKRSILLTSALASLALLSACGNNSGENNTQSATNDSLITSLPLSMNIKSAEKSYKITSNDPEFTCYLTISTSVQWPEAISDYDIKPLQDTILTLMYPDVKDPHDVNSAITQFVSDAKSLELGDEISEVDTVPQFSIDNQVYYAKCQLQMMEISDELVTLSITRSQYMGGAHPMTLSIPFTYDFDNSEIISFGWLFKDGADENLVPVLKEAIATQLNMTVRDLDDSLLSDFKVSDLVYILNGHIVFHYNPYEILPYSFGAIDAVIYPSQITDILTPQAVTLLKD